MIIGIMMTWNMECSLSRRIAARRHCAGASIRKNGSGRQKSESRLSQAEYEASAPTAGRQRDTSTGMAALGDHAPQFSALRKPRCRGRLI
jgi:hypothetical protein